MMGQALRVLPALMLTLWGCGQDTVRIGVATFSHETCTFCPVPTGIAEWEYYGPPVRGDSVLEWGDYIEGFVSRAREYGGVELVGILSPRDAKGGSSGSWITKEAFDKYSNGIAEDLGRVGRLDGVFLALHGAMAVTGISRPEAEIVRRVRAVVGDIPIFVTLDLHANEDHELSDAADAVFIVKRYPHYDARLQGERAARIMLRTIRGTYSPVMATRKPGVITPSVFQGTGESPAMDIMERARRWENRTPDAFVSVAFGFAYADVPEVGATVMVVANGDQELADRIADDMSEYIWRVREEFAGKRLPKTRAGVAQAIAEARAGNTPVVVADHADRTGNSTHILEELMRQGAQNFCIATIADSLAIRAIASRAEVGERVSVRVGGYADQFAGRPVPIEGVVEYLGEYGRFDTVAVLRFGSNNRVILTPQLHQVTTPGIFGRLGIDLDEVDMVVLKSRVHFWRGFVETGLAGAVVVVDAPGLGPADLTTIDYQNVPQGLYPLSRRD
ncbi:MAG: M81 family metallopeptidase [Gemmatimonadota bacterium]|nr:MAG: M81 family metallopeptidase [Gemmatimonadota bacterium]